MAVAAACAQRRERAGASGHLDTEHVATLRDVDA
jgi:hypothetical protein